MQLLSNELNWYDRVILVVGSLFIFLFPIVFTALLFLICGIGMLH